MKFPGFKGFSSPSSLEDDDPIPVVQPTATIDMQLLRSRLIQANTGPPDELWGLSNHVGKLVDKYLATTDPAARLLLLGHLYFATVSTMNKVESTPLPFAPVPTLKTPNAPVQTGRGRRVAIVGGPIFDLQRVRRRAALRELFAAAAGKLAHNFKTTINVLPRHLEDRFGIELSDHGIDEDKKRLPTDQQLQKGEQAMLAYLSQGERTRYRVIIRNGLAYVLKGKPGEVAEEVLLDTTVSGYGTYTNKHRNRAWGFVVSMSRELYVAHHYLVGNENGAAEFFHSSYFSGSNVLTAGDCMFQEGRLQSVTNLSGHYQPPDDSLVHFLELFRSHGADLSNVLVGEFVRVYGDRGRKAAEVDWSDPAEFEGDATPAKEFLARVTTWTREANAPRERHKMKDFQQLLRKQGRL